VRQKLKAHGAVNLREIALWSREPGIDRTGPRADVRVGSFATEMGYSRDVRLPPLATELRTSREVRKVPLPEVPSTRG